MFSSLPAARWWAAGLMVLGAITDKLDGMLARKRRQETEWGRIIDPLADKIAVAVVAFTLLYVGDIPVWFVVLLVARDVVIFSGGMYLKTTRGTVLGSNTTGKWAFGIAGLTLFVLLVSGMSIVAEALMLICVVLLATSFVLYVRRFLQVVGGNA
jgi:CDP-diacylglycerol--glycerol-3-phosphate 3-phosphatidyltransferase